MKKYTVNIFFPYSDYNFWGLFPDNGRTWENYEFILNGYEEECDFCIVFTKYNLDKIKVYCNPENLIFINIEPESIMKFTRPFLNQFGKVIGHRAQLLNKNSQNTIEVTPWFHKKTFTELVTVEPMIKSKTLSLINSNKIMNEGHEFRNIFCNKIKETFGNEVDFWGRGIRDFEDKWEVLAPSKFSIPMENEVKPFYITEKVFDCILSYTYPFYYGAPNIKEFITSITEIDIKNIDQSIRTIDKILKMSNFYENSVEQLKKNRLEYLFKYSTIPVIVGVLNKMNPNLKKSFVTIENIWIEKLYRRMFNLLYRK